MAAAAKEMSVDAAVASLLSDLDGIFTLKTECKNNTESIY